MVTKSKTPEKGESDTAAIEPSLCGRLVARWMWLFQQNPRGPLFAPTPITSLAIFVLAACIAFYVYVLCVQKAYRELFTAYDNANVIRDLLLEDPTIPAASNEEKIPGGRQAVLFRALQILGRKSQDDTPAELATPDDDFFGLYEALVSAPQAKNMPLLQTRTVLVMAQLARFASGSDTDLSAKNTSEPIERSATSLSCVLASQPTAVDKLKSIWPAEGPEPKSEQLNLVLDQLGTNLVLPKTRHLMWSLFPPIQATDSEAVALLFRQMGVDRKYNRLLNQDKTVATDVQKRHFSQIEDFIFTLAGNLHANHDVKKARAFITLVQGPEQLAMTVGFFWMILLMLVRFFKRFLIQTQFQKVRNVVYSMLGEIGSDDDEASLQKRQEVTIGLSLQMAAQTNQDHSVPLRLPALDRALNELSLSAKHFWRDGTASAADGPLKPTEAVKKETGHGPEHKVSVPKVQEAPAEGAVRSTPLRKRWVSLLLAILTIVGLIVVQLVYIIVVGLFWNGPLAVIRAGRVAINRLLEICINELNNKSPSSDVIRHSCRFLRERDRSSRWIIRWIARALPAIGFIGTVRGISAALSASDSIVRAQTTAEQAAAITAVAGTLGIAFTTTLIALMFGLITSYFDDLQSVQEGDFVRDVEETLVPLLEPSLFTSAVGSAPP